MTAEGYVVSEVRVEQWVLAALQLQHGLSLTPRRRQFRKPRKAARRTTPQASARGSLWLMLGACSLALYLL